MVREDGGKDEEEGGIGRGDKGKGGGGGGRGRGRGKGDMAGGGDRREGDEEVGSGCGYA